MMTGAEVTPTAARHNSLEEWFGILPAKLRQLVKEAENQSWPFVFEEWQFEQDSKKEYVSIKDLVLSENAIYPDMLEKDVLQECLEHACTEKAFETAAAVSFLLDRFMYWYGNSKYILDKVELIRKEAPTTPIAPQVILRKARFLKDSGSLQKADKTLDYILRDKRHKEQWQYKDESQYDLVCATCVQIKGVIKHNLGLWYEGADLILESVLRYNNLPKPDLKGIGSSLGILSDIFRNIALPDFKKLLTKYACRYDNPLMEAYGANKQAAWLARFELVHFARNTRRAGELLLMFTVNLPPADRPSLINQALDDLKMSLRAHTSLTALTSREQLYEFTVALYHCVLAFCLLGTPEATLIAIEVEKFCMIIYDFYCASTGVLRLNDDFVKAVHHVLRLLELPQLSDQASDRNVFVDLPTFDYQYPTLRGATPKLAETTQDTPQPKHTPGRRSRFRKRGNGHNDRSNSNTQESLDKGKAKAQQEMKDFTIANPSATTVVPSTSKEADTKVLGLANSSVEVELHPTGAKPADPLEEKTSAAAPYQHPVTHSQETSRIVGETDRGSVNPYGGHQTLADEVDLSYDAHDDVDDVEGEGATAESGYSGSISDSTCPEPGDAFLHNEDSDEYMASVLLPSAEGNQTQLPQTFLRTDPTKPISCFVDASVPSLYGERESLAGDAKESTVDSIQDLSLKTGAMSLEPLSVHRARVFKYDPVQSLWTCLTTLVYLDEELAVGRKGVMRDVIKLQYLNQDEPKARYVGKRYRKAELRNQLKNYYQDVLCQMTARHYVALFNQALRDNPAQGWQIQFVPAAHIQLLSDDHKDIVDVFNVEPYVEGSDFVKVTNNEKHVNPRLDKRLVAVSLAFMHFTYNQSGGDLLVTDLQGWLPQDQAGTIIFTDPAIHSVSIKCFETANLGEHGFRTFWRFQHPECNDICRSLGLTRPTTASS